jgi:O-methyltransferase
MSLTIDQELQNGVDAHNEGNLQEAERIYRSILQSQPKNPDANHNLGILIVASNKPESALPLFKTALDSNPKIEKFWLSYIDALIKERQFDNAKLAIQQAKKKGAISEKVEDLNAHLRRVELMDIAKLYMVNKQEISRLAMSSGLEDVPHQLIATNAVYAPWENDESFNQMLYKIKGKTLVDKYCLYELWSLAGQLAKIPGDVIEVGTWKGGSGCLIASRFAKENVDVTSYLCDTFDGVAKAGEKDTFYKNGEHANSCVEEVEALAETLNVRNSIKILKGIFPDETGAELEDKKFRLCHIDVDTYQGTKEVTEWVWERLSIGGVIVYDDCGSQNCPGVSRFVNEQINNTDRFTIYNLNGHAVAIKSS